MLGQIADVLSERVPRRAAARSPPPQRIGPWRVIREIGRGGAGVVFEASHAGGRGRAAVKLAFPHAAQTVAGEADLLGRFDHPAVVRRLGAGTHVDGLPYVAMEAVEGVSLPAHVRTLSGRERMGCFRALCRAVEVVHRQRVVHGDLTPSNIIVRPDGRIVLLDFGSAVYLDARPQGHPRRPLTPEFAAPEQILGQPTSEATDVYALGLLLHELLCGRRRRLPWALCGGRPTQFDGVEPDDIATETLTRRIRARHRALARTSRSRSGGLDWKVEALLHTALKTDPRDRFPTAGDLATALDTVLQGTTTDPPAFLLP